jgi:hypothetical protein
VPGGAVVNFAFQGGTAIDSAGTPGNITTALNAGFGSINLTTGAVALNTGLSFSGGNKFNVLGAGTLISGSSGLIGGALSWCAGNSCTPVAPTGTTTGSFNAKFFGVSSPQAVIINGTLLNATPNTAIFIGVGKL